MVNVFLTIDTECSMGGAWDHPELRPVAPERAILGKIGNEYYGTPLIMDVLEGHGLRGVFFVEVLAKHVVPASQLSDAYGDIVRRGHDTQLHIHPVYHYYRLFQQGRITRPELPPSMDLIGSLPPEVQLALLREGLALLREFTGKTAVAYRAGSYGASRATLGLLAQLGLAYDSSFNAAYLQSTCLMRPVEPTNIPWREQGIWEVPLTNFIVGTGQSNRFKPLDVGAVSLAEMQRVLEQAEQLGMNTVVFILHSFTLFKKADAQFRRLRPDRLVIRRFRGLCKFLKENDKRFAVRTFADNPSFAACRPAPFPKMGSLLPLCRKVIQGVNRNPWL